MNSEEASETPSASIKPPTVSELFAPPAEKPYSAEKEREKWRGPLALAMVGLLTSTVVLAFLAFSLHWGTEQEIKDLLVAIFPPLVALTGTALGFYFGGQTKP